MQDIELLESYPAAISQALVNGEIDLGLVPVAVIPRLKEHHILTDYCIGADGEVASVCIFSEVPLENVKQVYLDYQSRTSVRLAQILLKEYWQVNVEFIPTSGEDYRTAIKGTTAGVVIGDRALEQRRSSEYIYDLGTAWKAHTGLPFVFAAWISNKIMPVDFIQSFNEANKQGLDKIETLLKEFNYPYFDLEEYFTNYIDYQLNDLKIKGLNLFLERINYYNL
jgi:chorismate dehydratase